MAKANQLKHLADRGSVPHGVYQYFVPKSISET